MADFLNLQFNGLPVVMYSMAALTTGVLAYATAGGEFGNLAKNAMASLMPPQEMIDNPQEAIENSVNSAVESAEQATESVTAAAEQATESVTEAAEQATESLNPAAEPSAESDDVSSLQVEKNEESPNAIGGGKKRKRNKKTPRNKKTSRKSKKGSLKRPRRGVTSLK